MRVETVLRCVVLLESLAVAGPARAQGTDLAASLLRDEAGRVPEDLAGFRLVSARQDEAIHYVFTLDLARPSGENLVELTLTPRDEARPALARSASFNIEYRGPTVGGRPAPAVRPLADAVVAAVTRNDPGGLLVPPPKPAALGEGRVPAHVALVDQASAWTGLALVVLFLLYLPWTARRLAADLRVGLGGEAPDASRLAAGSALVAVACGLAFRLLLPHLPVMYYMGYHLADTAARLQGIPKYGPGALALYHLVFRVTGTDHVAMMVANSVLGSLTPLAGGALLARVGLRGWGVAGGIALLALTPLFVKDATTESLLVPTTLWMLSGLALFLRAREDGRSSTMSLALLHLVLAMLSRPEAVVLVPLCAGLLVPVASRASRDPRPRTLARLAPWAAAAVVLLVRAAQLSVALDVEFARGNHPVLRDPAGLWSLVPDLWRRDVLLWSSLFPAGVTALAAAGLVLGPRRAAAGALLAAAVAWIAVSLVDLPYVSIPRVQVPGGVFCALAAGVGVAGVHRLVSRKPWLLVTAGAAVLILVGATMAGTLPGLWAPTNADDEERLLRDARDAIPADRPFILVRRGYDDEPVERLHLHYPDYWFEPPARDGLAVGPDWFDRTDAAGRDVYFVLGTRCYMRRCGETDIHPACRRMRERYRLEPVIERTVPVRDLPVDRGRRPGQDLDFPWCLAARGEMTIGLYRVTVEGGGSSPRRPRRRGSNAVGFRRSRSRISGTWRGPRGSTAAPRAR